MAESTLTLVDELGRSHRVTREADGRMTSAGVDVTLSVGSDGTLLLDGSRHALLWAVVSDNTRWVFLDGHVFTFEMDRPAGRRRRSGGHSGPITAPMPATVRRIAVAAGDPVRRGDVLVVLEAMKMELPVRATTDGRVEAVNCHEGEMVQSGDEIIRVGEGGEGG